MQIDFTKLFFDLQEQIVYDPHRFKVVSCGRRWGKTFMAMGAVLYMLMEGWNKTGRKQRGWVVAPTFPLVREDWLTAEIIFKDLITSKNQTEMRMHFGDRAVLEFKSAEREDEGLRGAGLDCGIIDESSRVSKKSWEQGIRPALADKQGRAIFISTPKGRNWFFDLYQQGLEENREIKSWKFPTYTNPYFPKNEWEVIEKTTPEMILKQEYLADFLEDEATVFKNINKCIRGSFEEPNDRESYTIGLDLGKAEDFTVSTVIRHSDCQVVYVHRMNKIDWTLQKEHIKAITSKYRRATVWIDSTGLGDPIENDLNRSGVNTQSYKFTNETKQELVEQLIVAIEQVLIGIPNCQETEFLLRELKSFTYEILPSGKLRYEAPSGMHDDGVISLGLAVRGISNLLYRKKKVIKPINKAVTADDVEKMYERLEQFKNRYGPQRGAEMLRIHNIKRVLR